MPHFRRWVLRSHEFHSERGLQPARFKSPESHNCCDSDTDTDPEGGMESLRFAEQANAAPSRLGRLLQRDRLADIPSFDAQIGDRDVSGASDQVFDGALGI